jgi:hypothetical protein
MVARNSVFCHGYGQRLRDKTASAASYAFGNGTSGRVAVGHLAVCLIGLH